MNYICAKIQAEICMFTQQNRWGLNLDSPILHLLWLMMSAAADVISVPGVIALPKISNALCYIRNALRKESNALPKTSNALLTLGNALHKICNALS